jgi:hypothetical protein
MLERAKGIEPSYAAWEAAVLPLNYAREYHHLIPFKRLVQYQTTCNMATGRRTACTHRMDAGA